MKKALALALALVLCSVAAVSAQELKIDYQYRVTGPDAGNYFLFTGPVRYMDSGASRYAGTDGKDAVGSPDATSHASKYHSTEFFNHYRYDLVGKKAFPDGLRGLFLFAVSVDSQRAIDDLQVAKRPDGAIGVRYVHRGTAYEIVTDASGKLSFPTKGLRMRTIGHTNNLVSTDFSPNGKVESVNWAKVWDASIPAGQTVANTTSKTGRIVSDDADPVSKIEYTGDLTFSFDGGILKVAGALRIVSK